MHLAMIREHLVAPAQNTLDFDSRLDRLHHAVEDRQHTVAGGINDAAFVRLDFFEEVFSIVGLCPDWCAVVVRHQPGVTRDVSR